MIERRRHPRVKVSQQALYFSDIHSRPMAATTVDLSVGGTRIETQYSLIVGERLEIFIVIRPHVIKSRGQVVHVLELPGETPKAGVRFEGLSKQDRLHLEEYVSRVMRQGE